MIWPHFYAMNLEFPSWYQIKPNRFGPWVKNSFGFHFYSDFYGPFKSVSLCHNDFPPRLGRPQIIQWSRHRSFLYGCDRSPEVHVLKLGIEIPNLR